MATTTARPAGRGTGRAKRQRRPGVPGRGKLGAATVMVLVGSFMPWVYTALGSVSGARGAGLWTFYAAVLGLAGVMLPLRRVAAVHGALLALAAVALPVWQVVHLLGLVGTDGWAPGPGLVLVFGGGVLAGVGALTMWRSAYAAAPPGR